jgi:hypothetical protein
VSSLAKFHSVMAPFLRGESTAADVERLLGPSPSGTARLALYPLLVRRQATGLVDHFFRALAAALEVDTPGAFARLRDAYLVGHPPKSWEPNENLRAFPAFVSAWQGAPSWAAEMADYAWARFVAMHADRVSGDVGLERAVFVRHYTHDVLAASRANESTTGASRTPRPAPETLVFARHAAEGHLVTLTPSVAALFALLGASGEVLPPLPPGVTEADLALELAALRKAGILP